MRGKSEGFTLVELMIVVIVVAILAAIGLPSFRSLIASQKVKTMASRLQVALLTTRSEALKRNTNVTLAPTVAGQWNGGWHVINPADGKDVSAYAADTSVTITGPASVIYQGSGRVSAAAAASFKFSASGTSDIRCVFVDLSGVPSVASSGC